MRILAEEAQLVQAFNAIDLAAGANTGDWVSMKNYGYCEVVLIKEPGPAAEPVTITLLQATAVAGTGSKALNIAHGVYKKSAATDLAAVGTFTKVAATTANTYALEDSLHAAVVCIPVFAEDLDVEGGFDCVSITIADPGAAGQLGAAFYLLTSPRYTPPPSAIVD